MDVIILCGGKGTRLSEETINKPKPMVEIGSMPILWHIMKYYSCFGFRRFILCLGFKGEYIKQYFLNYKNTAGNYSIKLDPESKIEYYNHSDEKNWEIVFVDTGLNTFKGGRLKRVEKYIKSDNFHLTYGDGVANVNLDNLVSFHKSHDLIGTVTAVRPPSRFGEIKVEKDMVIEFEEKPQMDSGYINGGFFIFNKNILSELTDDERCDFEFGPLQDLAKNRQMKAFKHDQFWQCMDNVRERDYLIKLIEEGNAPWKIW